MTTQHQKLMRAMVSTFYGLSPPADLFHYTSASSYLSILKSKSLWASEIRYMNDAQEMAGFANWLSASLAASIGDPTRDNIRQQFLGWVNDRVRQQGHSLFVLSLSQEGNQLSQWRAYTKHNQGLSIGFDSQRLLTIARAQGFELGRCMYASAAGIAEEVERIVVEHALAVGPSGREGSNPAQSYYQAFYELEPEILRLAALFKHPAFEEEREWRLVSPVVSNHVAAGVKYRPSNLGIVPYTEFDLSHEQPISRVFLGPTAVPNLYMSAVNSSLGCSGLAKGSTVINTLIPLRPA